jgi:KUP system potassium uptake protein
VLSALEGLKLPAPGIAPYVVPLSVAVLIGIFALQPQGSARIGKLFGPVMTVWFIVIGVLGFGGVMSHPGVLVALDPRYGFAYLFSHGFTGFLVLGAVFLCATGAEALYADMGHFGPRPIRFTWYGLVLPMLLLNYAGQAAAVVEGGVAAGANPFFVLCPAPLQVPLVVLATFATIIASQAIISGAFSMTRQAIQLGLCPRLHITQTSADGYGQIYVGSVNWVLLTSVLMFLVMREIWGWRLPASLLVAGLFIVVDLSFVSANLMKVFEGGYVPLIIAAVIFFLIWTWRRGRELMLQRLERDTLQLATFIKQIHGKSRVPGTAVYLTSRTDVVPVPLLHNLKHNKVIHQRIVLLHVATENAPYIAVDQRIQVTHLMDDFHSVVIHYGFMEQPDIPQVLDACGSERLRFDLMETSFFVGRLTIVPGAAPRMSRIRINLFEAMHRNALAATEFFRIPPNRVIELGGQIEL